MSFRTVVISNRCKLDYQMNYLVVRGIQNLRIYIPEISILIIESTAVSITSALMVELIKNKVKVIFCDEKHLPCFQLIGYNDNFHSSKQIYLQSKWNENIKKEVWSEIIRNKIRNQAKLLQKYNIPKYQILESYVKNIELGDSTNREGLAAKVYFHSLFGLNGRHSPTFINSALNYGYAILLSAVCREVTACGCITQLGIWHNNEFNPYNLASDLMEPYRIIVDDMALNLEQDDVNFKEKMANLLNGKVKICGKWVHIDNAIETYTRSVISALNENNVDLIKNYIEYEIPIYENISDV